MMTDLDMATLRAGELEREVNGLRTALERSVTLQSQYATLLNDYDGGERIAFGSAQEWLERLAEIARRFKTK